MELPRPDEILEADFWPEPVRVLTARPLGSGAHLEVVGTKTRQFYSRILSRSDLQQVRTMPGQRRDFAGSPEAFFLAVESHRLRLAHQLDPLFAVNVSQVDPLPHQIEAVYHHMLRRARGSRMVHTCSVKASVKEKWRDLCRQIVANGFGWQVLPRGTDGIDGSSLSQAVAHGAESIMVGVPDRLGRIAPVEMRA